MNAFFGHFCTITRHRHEVIKNCFRAGILWQGLLHDLSKYTPVEFFEGVRFYQGNRSPNEGAREKNGFSAAWLHHKGVNKHHFEHWTDYDYVTKRIVPVKMPTRYVAEMFCDRVAASKVYMKDTYNDKKPLEYFLRGKPTRIIHPETSDELENMLTILAEKGEQEAFEYIRALKK